MSFFDDLKNNLSSIIKSQQGAINAIGLDIGSSSIKVVQLRKEKGKALLETYGEIALGPYASLESGKAVKPTVELVSPAVRDLFREANVVSQDAGMSVPFSSAMTRIIKVPNLSKDQLSKIIPIEARKFIPMPLNEVVLNWFVLPKNKLSQEEQKKPLPAILSQQENKIDFQEALIVAIHKDAVANAQSMAKQLNLNVSFFELETFSALRSSVEYELTNTMLVDIGAMSTKIYIVEAGILRFTHMINLGSQNISENIMRAFSWPFDKAERLKKELGIVRQNINFSLPESDRDMFEKAAESATNRIFTEVNRILIAYEKKYNKSVAKVVLAGAGANMPGLLDYASRKLSVGVQKADPFDKVQAPAFLQDVLKGIGPDFSVAVGLALRKLSLS